MSNIFQQTEPEAEKTERGRNVRHITRVTGYLSWTSGWNKGKVAELADRHRNDLNKSEVSLFGWYGNID